MRRRLPILAFLGVLVVILSFGAGSARTIAVATSPKLIHVDTRDKAFVPALVDAHDGDTISFCNKDPFNDSPFTMSRFNAFGSKIPGKSYGDFLLRPGACRNVTVHNPGTEPVLVNVLDDLHSVQELHIIVLPAGWTGAAPTLSSLQPKAPVVPAVAGAFPGGTVTVLTLKLGDGRAVTNLKTGPSGSVDTTAKNTETLSGYVALNGTLPKGWVVVVWYPTPEYVLYQGETGGTFGGVIAAPSGFVGRNGAGAYICRTKAPPVCEPSGQANVFVNWTAG
jgi:hypothetical protein